MLPSSDPTPLSSEVLARHVATARDQIRPAIAGGDLLGALEPVLRGFDRLSSELQGGREVLDPELQRAWHVALAARLGTEQLDRLVRLVRADTDRDPGINLLALVQLAGAAPEVPWDAVRHCPSPGVREAFAHLARLPADVAEAWGAQEAGTATGHVLRAALLGARAASETELGYWATQLCDHATVRWAGFGEPDTLLCTPGRDTWIVQGESAAARLACRPDLPHAAVVQLVAAGGRALDDARHYRPDWPAVALDVLRQLHPRLGPHVVLTLVSDVLGRRGARAGISDATRLEVLEEYVEHVEVRDLAWLDTLGPADQHTLRAMTPGLLRRGSRPLRLRLVAALAAPARPAPPGVNGEPVPAVSPVAPRGPAIR